jgi:hypothetical protein
MRSFALVVTLILIPVGASSQDRPQTASGPAIEGYGATFRVAAPAFATDLDMENGVQVALSAMAADVTLQSRGFTLIQY